MLKKKRTQHVVFPSVVHRVTPLHFIRCSLLIRFWTADCLVMIVNVLQNSAMTATNETQFSELHCSGPYRT